MPTYMIRRALQMIVVLLVAAVFIYALLNLANMARILGLNKPFLLRYVTWLVGDDWLFGPWEKWRGESRGLLRGDWGLS